MNSKLILCLALVLSGGSFNFANLGLCNDETATNALTKPEVVNSLSSVSTSVSSGYSNFIPSATMTTTNLMGTNYAPVVQKVLVNFETNALNIITNTTMMEMSLATKFLTGLKKQGRLPGVLPDSHAEVTGNLHSDNLLMSEFKEAKYPFSLTFNVVLSGDSLTNHYTVERASADAAWQLQRAWRTDAEGNTLIEWPTK
jgi:hypothetical protein